MKLSKCHFFTKEIQYLGHILSTKGIKPLLLNTQAIKNMHLLKMPKQVCAFLGLVGYYRMFIKNFAKIAKTLTLLTCQQAKLSEHQPMTMVFSIQEISHPSTNLTLSKSKETLHSLYRCIWWCLWSKTIPGTWWNRIPNSFPITHIHWHSMEMEHYRTGSLWCILHSHKMELLPSRSWNNSTQWPQTIGKIL